MPSDIVLGLTALGIVLVYIVVVWKLSWLVAELVAMPFRRAGDDEISHYAGEGRPSTGWTFTPITRGDRRMQLVWAVFVLPPVAYLHYRFWDPLVDGMAWLFEEVLGPFIVDTFYSAVVIAATRAIA